MLNYAKRAGFMLCALLLAACAQSSTVSQEDQVIVAGSRAQDAASPVIAPPPAPPPPPMMAAEIGAMQRVAPYAQTAPQPMPGTVDTERYEDVEVNPIHVVAEDPVSTFSIDVDTASYSNVRRFLSEGRLPPRDAVRIEELINYFRYEYPLPRDRAQPFSTNVTVAPSPWAEGRQLVHIGLQGYNIVPRERPPLNLVLLLDVSGSMNAPNKLPLLQQSFRLLIDQLNARDRVAIVVYAGAAGTVLEPTPGNEHARILAALDSLRPGGSTAGAEGLRQAYALAEQNFNRNAVNRVIIATDGDFNVGINDPQQLQDFVSRKRETGVYLSVFGFGGGNYNDALMQRLAQNGNGVAAYIDTLNEARRVLRDEMASNMFSIANDVKIQVEFNPAVVKSYRLIGYVNRDVKDEDFRNDAVDGGEIGAGHAATALYEIKLHDNAAGHVATATVRYKLDEEGQAHEISQQAYTQDLAREWSLAPLGLRLAGNVAEFAEILANGFYARGATLEPVIADLEQIAPEWREEQVDELLKLVRKAAELKKD